MSIYADNAATTKISPGALAAMIPCFEEYYANPSSLHAPGQKAAELLARARSDIALCLNALPREIYFTSGGSESDNQALLTGAALGQKQGKRRILSTAFEHHAVLHRLQRLEAEGFEVVLLPVHEDGLVRPEEVERAITPDTCLVSVMYANNEIGTIQPIEAIGAICHAHGLLFHTDAVQAAGFCPLDVKRDHIDLLSLSAHKFHGPKGVGVLYARQGILPARLIEGGAQERGRRAGTENLPGIVGMAYALREATAAQKAVVAHMLPLRERLIDGLSTIEHSVLNGDREKRLAGNVNFCFEGIEGESLLLLLSDRGIAASSGSACTSGALDPSHVLLALGRPHEIAHGSLRLTLSPDVSAEEIDEIIAAVRDVVAHLRGFSPVYRDCVEGKRPFLLP